MSAVTVTYHELPPLNSWATTGLMPCDGLSGASSNASTDTYNSNIGEQQHLASTSTAQQNTYNNNNNNNNNNNELNWCHSVNPTPQPLHEVMSLPLHSQSQQAIHNMQPMNMAVSVCNTPCSTPQSIHSPHMPHYWSPAPIDANKNKQFMQYPSNTVNANISCGNSLLEQSLMSMPQPNSNTNTSNNSAEELCLVCGDKASGYHYNALTCEGCKGFFRRSITRKAVYYCKYGGHCDIDMYMRRKCQCCRLRKCMHIGMRPELVIPEDQCRMKREAKRAIRQMNQQQHQQNCLNQAQLLSSAPDNNLPAQDRDSIGSTSHSTSPPVVSSSEQIYCEHNHNDALFGNDSTQPMQHPIPQNLVLSTGQRELVNRVVAYQQQFDSPSDEALANLSTFHTQSGNNGTQPNSPSRQTPAFQHLAELTILNVQLIVEFTKQLPGFTELCRQDQLTLQKACATEILMLRTARCYDVKTDSLVLGNANTSWAYTRQQYRHAGMGHLTEAIYDFSRTLARLKLDIAEYALLTAVAIFSDRSNLLEPKKIEDIQEVYTSALQHYIEVHRPKQRTFFARLLMKLTDLRTLGSEQADVFCALKLDTTGTSSPTSEYIHNNLTLQTTSTPSTPITSSPPSLKRKLSSSLIEEQQHELMMLGPVKHEHINNYEQMPPMQYYTHSN